MLHMWVRKGQGNKFRAALPSNGLPSLPVGKQSACSAGDLGLIPGSGRSPGEGNGNPLQYSCLENPMDCSRQAPLSMGSRESDMT